MNSDKVNILGISGSPRRNGHTSILINEALGAAKKEKNVETEMLNLAGMEIKPCASCFKKDGMLFCHTEKCILNDDMQLIYPKLIRADGIIIGSPVYYGGVPAQLKALMDRSEWVYEMRASTKLVSSHLLKDKVGGAITIGSDRHGGQEVTLMNVFQFFIIHGMIMVTDGAPTKEEIKEFAGIKYDSAASYEQAIMGRCHWPAAFADPRWGQVKKDALGIANARGLGRHVAQIAKWVKAHRPRTKVYYPKGYLDYMKKERQIELPKYIWI